MKKIFSLFAAVLMAGSMMANSFQLTFVEGTTEGSDVTTSWVATSDLTDIFATGSDMVDSLKVVSKVYGARPGCGSKFGTSSAAGELTFSVNVKIDSVVLSAAMYGASEGGDGYVIGNDTVTLSAGNKVFENHTWIPAAETHEISIKQVKAAKGRFYLNGITVYYTAGEPQPEPTYNYYLVGTLSENGWDQTKAMPMAGDSIVRHMAAGTYEFKVLPTLGSWDGALGYANVDLECSSENVRQSGENVQLILHEAGDVKIKVVAGWMCVTGVFGEPVAADW